MDGLNLYAYVGNNPVNWLDPWGWQTNDNPMRLRLPQTPMFIIGEAMVPLATIENVQTGLDVVGTFDPSGIADAVNAIISGSQGHWGDACLSAVSMFPYAGDAIGKGGKILGHLDELQDIAQTIAKGHARAKHSRFLADEADELGTLLHEAMERATEMGNTKKLRNSRMGFYDEVSRRVIIVDPQHADKGTFIRFATPQDAQQYFDELR